MQVQSLPLGAVTIGTPIWSENTARFIRRAERLVRQTRTGRTGTASRPRSCGVSALPLKHTETTEDNQKKWVDIYDYNGKMSRPQTAVTMYQHGASGKGSTPRAEPFPPPCLRERCAEVSASVAGEYIRQVREVELQLRRQAGRVSQEVTKLERERTHLEMVLRGLRNDLQVNRRSVEERTKRPSDEETHRDGADWLLVWERRELVELTRDVEETLRETQNQLRVLDGSSRELHDWSTQQSAVLELLPHRGSQPTRRRSSPPNNVSRTDPPATPPPECVRIVDWSSRAVSRSQLLRDTIRHVISGAVTRQKAAHSAVNDSLVKKVAETTMLKGSLALTAAITRQAVSRKQREVNTIRHSYGRAQGPVASGDLFSREKLDRPLMQVFHRHPQTEISEARQLIQGSAVLRRCLTASEDDVVRLQGCRLQLLDDMQVKSAAARLDSAVVRMRRQLIDKRAVPKVLQ